MKKFLVIGVLFVLTATACSNDDSNIISDELQAIEKDKIEDPSDTK